MFQTEEHEVGQFEVVVGFHDSINKKENVEQFISLGDFLDSFNQPELILALLHDIESVELAHFGPDQSIFHFPIDDFLAFGVHVDGLDEVHDFFSCLVCLKLL